MNISPFFLLPLQKFSSHPEFSRYFDTNRGRVCRTRYASRIYSANSSTRGNERYGKWRGGIKDGKERTTREENERKILLSVIFLARPLSLSFVLRYRRNRSVIIWRLFGYIYPNIYPNGPPTFPLGKIKYLAALTVALRGRIPFVSQRRTSYIVSNSASRHRDYREERSGGREGGRGRKRKESKNVTCSTRYREISPLLKYNEARNLRIKGSCFQWRHDWNVPQRGTILITEIFFQRGGRTEYKSHPRLVNINIVRVSIEKRNANSTPTGEVSLFLPFCFLFFFFSSFFLFFSFLFLSWNYSFAGVRLARIWLRINDPFNIPRISSASSPQSSSNWIFSFAKNKSLYPTWKSSFARRKVQKGLFKGLNPNPPCFPSTEFDRLERIIEEQRIPVRKFLPLSKCLLMLWKIKQRSFFSPEHWNQRSRREEI